jgi:hypothetical protein
LSQWVRRSQRGWDEAGSEDMMRSRRLVVGAEYGGRPIAKSSRKVKLIVIIAKAGVACLPPASPSSDLIVDWRSAIRWTGKPVRRWFVGEHLCLKCRPNLLPTLPDEL